MIIKSFVQRCQQIITSSKINFNYFHDIFKDLCPTGCDEWQDIEHYHIWRCSTRTALNEDQRKTVKFNDNYRIAVQGQAAEIQGNRVRRNKKLIN